MLTSLKKPAWLNKNINLKDINRMKILLHGLDLNTVCQEASCPNTGECFSKGYATFIILGKICTRNCRFCGVKNGEPEEVNLKEPERVAEAIKRLNLKHAVITSVTRDDLPLGGAEVFAKTILAIRKKIQTAVVEVLIPDFKLNYEAIKRVVDVKPEIISHNIETIPSLYPSIRPLADYRRSLEVLRTIKEIDSKIYIKSAIMLGLGEEEDEVLGVFSDLREVSCDFLSIGQYLNPSSNHYPVKEYIKPEKFIYYKKKALELGFLHVVSGSYVRSSYKASEYLEESPRRLN